MSVKPPLDRIARCADDAPRAWRWAWRDLFALFPMAEGPGGYREVLSGQIGVQGGSAAPLSDTTLGRGAAFPDMSSHLKFDSLGAPPITDTSVLVVGASKTTGGTASVLGVRAFRSCWMVVWNGTQWSLRFQDVADYGTGLGSQTDPTPLGFCWTSGSNGTFYHSGGRVALGTIGSPSFGPGYGLVVNALDYNWNADEGSDKPILLAAVRSGCDETWTRTLVADPWSWITRRRVFAVKPSAAPASVFSLQHIYRHVAGIGA